MKNFLKGNKIFLGIVVGALIKGSYSYKESSRHGTCGIYIINTEKKRELMMAIQAFTDRYLGL